MNVPPLSLAFSRKMRPTIIRSAQILASYLLNAGILIVCIIVLDKFVTQSELQSFLIYFLICSISAGLEPGTSKASLTYSGPSGVMEGGISMMLASSVKALAISPIFAALWWYSAEGSVGKIEMGLTPIIVILGFTATDLRVAFDAQGRHALAIWGKQGSLALAAVVAAISLINGLGLSMGVALACLSRAVWSVAFWSVAKQEAPIPGTVRGHLFNRPWKHLLMASSLGALSASIDRIVAFRLLDPTSANTYVLIYEILTKFWLLSYILGPIIFVETIKSDNNRNLARHSYMLIAVLGVPFLIFASLLNHFPISVFRNIEISSWSLFVFGLAVLIATWNALLSIELQASNWSKSATYSAVSGLAVSIAAFPSFLFLWGVDGIFFAWLLKSAVEFVVLSIATMKARLK